MIVSAPPEYAEKIMDSVTASIKPFYDGYDRCFSVTDCKGTWRTLEGSKPFNGKTGEITVADEKRIEFIVREEDLKKAIAAIVSVHPYEEPAIDVIPCYGWKSFLQRSSSAGL